MVTCFLFIKVPSSSNLDAVLAQADRLIFDGLTSMRMKDGSPESEYWCECGSTEGAEQSTFIYSVFTWMDILPLVSSAKQSAFTIELYSLQ